MRIDWISDTNKLRWRVDVIISTGTLSRVMKPNITFQVNEQNIENILIISLL